MFHFKTAPECEERPQPMPEIRERRRSGSRRRVVSKRRSPAPHHRERASDSGLARPRPFDLDEFERRDEDKRIKYALLKPETVMQRQRSRSTGATADGRDVRTTSLRGGGLRLDINDIKTARYPERKSADAARPAMEEIVRDAPPELFEPMFVRVQELDLEDDSRPNEERVVHEDSQVVINERSDVRQLLSSVIITLQKGSDACTAQSTTQTPTGQSAWAHIANILSEHAFSLLLWADEAVIADVAIGAHRDESVRTAELALRRLILRAQRILGLISNGSPRLVPIPEDVVKSADVEGEKSSDEERTSKLPGPHLTPSRQLGQELKGLTIQVKTLRRLTRTIRDVSRSADDRSKLASHVEEVQLLFGTEAAIQGHGIGAGLPSDAALKQAREHMSNNPASTVMPSIVVS